MRHLDDDSLITWRFSEANHSRLFFPPASVRHLKPTSYMSSSPLPQWHTSTQSLQGRIPCRRNCFSNLFNSIPGIGISLGSFFLFGLIFYTTFLSQHSPSLLSSLKWSLTANHAVPSPTSDEALSSPSDSDVLSLEQIRDIVVPTRGFFSRDYSLYLGWNNVSIRDNPIRVELIYQNRCNIFSTPPSSKQICLIAPWLFLHLFMHVHASIICTYFFWFHTPCDFITTRL
jgi:hypothetical protein